VLKHSLKNKTPAELAEEQIPVQERCLRTRKNKFPSMPFIQSRLSAAQSE
jgi:hypothetical protein